MKMTRSKSPSYHHFHPQYAEAKRRSFGGGQVRFVWLIILSVFLVSAFFESKAGEQKGYGSAPHAHAYNQHLSPEICSHYLAGPAPHRGGPRYSTLDLGKKPVPANLPNQPGPKIGFEIAPRLPNHPYLPRRGVAGWAEIDTQSGQALINGVPANSRSGPSHDEIVEACLALLSPDALK